MSKNNQPMQVSITTGSKNLNATMARSCLTAGITAAKMNDMQTALQMLNSVHEYVNAIEYEIVDNPSKG